MAQNVTAILNRIKTALGYSTDVEIATRFSVAHNAVAAWKSRKSIPMSRLVTFCEDENLNLNWLLSGEGEMRPTTYEAPRAAGRVSEPAPIQPLNDLEQAVLDIVEEGERSGRPDMAAIKALPQPDADKAVERLILLGYLFRREHEAKGPLASIADWWAGRKRPPVALSSETPFTVEVRVAGKPVATVNISVDSNKRVSVDLQAHK